MPGFRAESEDVEGSDVTPVELEVLRHAAGTGSLGRDGSRWVPWTVRGARALPHLAQAVVTRTVNRLTSRDLRKVETAASGTRWGVPTAEGGRRARIPPPRRFTSPETNTQVHDMFRTDHGGILYVKDAEVEGAVMVGVGHVGLLSVSEARRLHAALGDFLAEVDEPSKHG